MTTQIPISPRRRRHLAASADGEAPFGVNAMRLSLRQWSAALLILAACIGEIPQVWKQIEPLPTGPDDRVPYSLSKDYWLYQRRPERVSDSASVAVLGDSVVWGHYVPCDQTLSAHLNRLSGGKRFANLGVNGAHPAALLGLVDHFGQAIARRKVLLHCNLLWMSSKRHDLQDKRAPLNHPALVPQFFPRIPCYNEPLSVRLGVVIGRQVPLLGWARHLQIAYFGNRDLPSWTLEHPRENPLSAITLAMPSPDEPPSPPPLAVPWTTAGLEKFDAPWVALETSFQWRCFRQTVEILLRRGNQVFVLVGPFNEHMLTERSRGKYRELLGQADAWLSRQAIPHCVAPVLPSDDYADASHPLAEGYARLARQLLQESALSP